MWYRYFKKNVKRQRVKSFFKLITLLLFFFFYFNSTQNTATPRQLCVLSLFCLYHRIGFTKNNEASPFFCFFFFILFVFPFVSIDFQVCPKHPACIAIDTQQIINKKKRQRDKENMSASAVPPLMIFCRECAYYVQLTISLPFSARRCHGNFQNSLRFPNSVRGFKHTYLIKKIILQVHWGKRCRLLCWK